MRSEYIGRDETGAQQNAACSVGDRPRQDILDQGQRVLLEGAQAAATLDLGA